jgi:hypothetical protein
MCRDAANSAERYAPCRQPGKVRYAASSRTGARHARILFAIVVIAVGVCFESSGAIVAGLMSKRWRQP